MVNFSFAGSPKVGSRVKAIRSPPVRLTGGSVATRARSEASTSAVPAMRAAPSTA